MMEGLNMDDLLDQLGLSKNYKSSQESFSFMSYLQLIDWREPWLVALLTSHLVLFIAVIALRNTFAVQSILGLFMLAIVYMSENINEFAAQNWQSFAGQQYFDSKGFFISTVLSAPLLFNCLIVVMNFLLQNYYILKDVRRMKLRQSVKSREANSDHKLPNEKKVASKESAPAREKDKDK